MISIRVVHDWNYVADFTIFNVKLWAKRKKKTQILVTGLNACVLFETTFDLKYMI